MVPGLSGGASLWFWTIKNLHEQLIQISLPTDKPRFIGAQSHNPAALGDRCAPWNWNTSLTEVQWRICLESYGVAAAMHSDSWDYRWVKSRLWSCRHTCINVKKFHHIFKVLWGAVKVLEKCRIGAIHSLLAKNKYITGYWAGINMSFDF